METFNYILRRVGQMLIALFVSSIIVFFMIRLIPGNPAQNLLGDFADPDAVAAMEEKMGLNDPYIVQYGIFLRDLARLDLGDSLKYKTSVASLMGDRMVITGLLTLVSVIFTVLISMPLGYLAGKKKDSWIDQVIRGFSISKYAVNALTEAINQEGAPFHIRATCVKPFDLRTNYLASNHLKHPKVIIDCYNPIHQAHEVDDNETHGGQPGDPNKVAELFIKLAEEPAPPCSLFLDYPVEEFVHRVIDGRRAEIDKWEKLACEFDA